MHDPELRDNPPAPNGGKRTRPFDFQQHLYNQSHPDILKFLERLRRLTDHYEIASRWPKSVASIEAEMRAFTSGERRLNGATASTSCTRTS